MRASIKLDKCLCIFSPLLAIFGFVLILTRSQIKQLILDTQMVISPSALMYPSWEHFTSLTRDVYFFNWTNPQDIYNKTIKPKFQELGPYRFDEERKKSDLKFNDNGTVTYKQLRFWHFKGVPEYPDLEDNITSINPIALTSLYKSRSWNYFLRKGLSWALSKDAPTIHTTRTVKELIFDGYSDTLLNMANTFPFLDKSPYEKFAWFYNRNGSSEYEGVFNVGTGRNNTLGKLYQWNYLDETPYYRDNCAKFDGSAGEIFERHKQDTIRLFTKDMCRNVELKYVGQSSIKNIVGNKYAAGDEMLDNGTIHPKNKCSCNGDCLPFGAVNATSCYYGCPIFVSLPHFYKADPYYLNTMEGLHPEENKHECFVTVEPTTGVPLEARVRVQINLLLQPFSDASMYEHAPKILLPVWWFEERMILPSYDAILIKLVLYVPTMSIILGTVMIICSIVQMSYVHYKKKSTKEENNGFLVKDEMMPLKQ